MSDIGPDTPVRLRPGAVSWREVDGEVVLLDLTTSAYFGVNASGTLLWQMLDAGTTPADMTGALVAEFDVDRDRASTDVEAFLAEAQRLNLVEV
ncbi:PqqD family protein [Nocardioides flavescens]|uniref:PqqD family peptide modification chaperone n=1 Tax=Nocardioides flavescens TaxID=2691959 RepID=A0A6L7F119_9ACTN|nr:PqqD family protein [Nocardioides flavescens]MXG89952.1 PqqD family peptide modification chaperone [Nocardioides flavescens]